LGPEIYKLEDEAKQMKREYQTVWYTGAFFVQYKRVKTYLPGANTVMTGEDEIVIFHGT
jgi:hypothetical protein